MNAISASDALDRARQIKGGIAFDYFDGTLEIVSSPFPGGPDHESGHGQRFGTSYLWARWLQIDGLETPWGRVATRSLAIAAIRAAGRASAVVALAGLLATEDAP